MVLKERIKQMVTQALTDYPHLFLVDVEHGDTPQSFRFLVDGDAGVGIHDCAALSRNVSKMIDESELAEETFSYEISSPGADKPLTLARQYPKHVGRTLELLLDDGSSLTGSLRSVSDSSIVVEEKPVKKLKKGEEPKVFELPFDRIKQSRIIITFK